MVMDDKELLESEYMGLEQAERSLKDDLYHLSKCRESFWCDGRCWDCHYYDDIQDSLEKVHTRMQEIKDLLTQMEES